MTAPTLTKPQERALVALRDLTQDRERPRAAHPRDLARRLWPDAEGWHRSGHRHDGKAGAKGAAMWLNAARMLSTLQRLGMARLAMRDGTGNDWEPSPRGLAYLQERGL